MDFPSSFRISRASSACEISRPKPRSAPSTSRRYRSFSPSVILQSAITILQIVIDCQEEIQGSPNTGVLPVDNLDLLRDIRELASTADPCLRRGNVRCCRCMALPAAVRSDPPHVPDRLDDIAALRGAWSERGSIGYLRRTGE